MAAPRKGKLTQAEMAALVGTSEQSLRKWAKEGVDITDEDAVRERAERMEKRGGEVEDYNAARLRKLSAEADLKEHELLVEKGLYVSSEAELAAGQKAGLAIMGAFLKMSSELTPMLAGRPAGEVKKILDKYARAKLNELASYDEKLSVLLG